MSKSFDAAKEITIAALGFTGGQTQGSYPYKELGTSVAEFFTEVYQGLKKIEDDQEGPVGKLEDYFTEEK